MELGTIQRVDIDEEVQQAYLDYAMSVIVARALPDARDGLKPVQRRILYAMHDMNIHPGGGFKKSARIVGEVLGKYHPHGDMAVYEAMARMAQDFSLRYPLVEGQGNFGSMDGDAPAAMRYTEARLAPLAVSMLADLDKETVPFAPNFDGTLQEPQVLPSAAPSLLINGATGIAVGMATSIPPHNLGEVCQALVFMLRSWTRTKEISTDELLKFVKGPDFPTGGLILDRPGREEGLPAAYGSGRGKITVRAKVHWEESGKGRARLLVTELPYQVNKSALLERIAELARAGRLEGIADLRDESDRQGMRIVIELARSADAESVLRNLFQHTPMETTFSIILLALVRGEPRLLSLKQALRVFLDHRLEVIQNRSQFDLARARERAHILQGLRVALKNLEEVIRLIRNARTAEDASGRLQKRYRLTQVQAEAFLDMPLRRLASLEREKIEQEYKEKVALMTSLERVLGSPKLQREALIEELKQLEQRFGDGRRTTILPDGDKLRNLPIAAQADHPEEMVWLTLTDAGLLSRGVPSRQSLPLPHTPLKAVLRASTRDTLYLLTEKGRLAGIPIEAVPEREAHEPGVHFSALCGLEGPSKVECAVSVPPSAKDRKGYLTLVTRRGMVKKSRLQDLPRPSPQVVSAIKLGPQDGLGWAAATSGKDELLLLTSAGMSIRFSEQEVRPSGLSAAGVLAVRLGRGGDQVAWAGVIQPRCDLLMMGEDGSARRTSITEFPPQGRHGVGTRAWKAKLGGRLVGAVAGRGKTRILLCLSDGSVQSQQLGDFSRRKRSSDASSAVKLGRGQRISAVIAMESPPLGAQAARRPSSGAGHQPTGRGRPPLGRGKLPARPDSTARKSKRYRKGKALGRTRGDRGQ